MIQTSIEKMGYLSTSSSFPPLCLANGVGLQKAKVGHVTQFKLLLRDRFGEALDYGKLSLQCLSAFALLHNVILKSLSSYGSCFKHVHPHA